jgi:hypothetical protein
MKKLLSAIIAIMVAVNLLPAAESFVNSAVFPTPDGFCDNDFQKLVGFALQGDNIERLRAIGVWDLYDPNSWERITWNDESPRRVVEIDFWTSVDCDTGLGLSGNLDVSEFQALESLEIKWCNIVFLNVSNTPILRELFIVNSGIERLDVMNTPSLLILDVYGGRLTNLDVSTSPLLETIDVSWNGIADVSSLENLTNLRYVNFSHNRVYTSVRVPNCPVNLSILSKIRETTETNGGEAIFGPFGTTVHDSQFRCSNECCIFCNNCKNCPDCGFHGGRFGFGRVTNANTTPAVGDALAILRFLVGLSNPIDTCNDARAAANIITPGLGDPVIGDALAILRHIIGLPSALD